MSIAVEIVRMTGDFVKENAKAIIITAAGSAGSAVAAAAITKKKDNEVILKEKESSFKAGVKTGVKIAEDHFDNALINPILAQIAVAYYVARVDGSISKKEKQFMDNEIGEVIQKALPEPVIKEIAAIIEDKRISFDKVRYYLDRVESNALEDILENAYDVANANGKVSADEEKAINEICDYMDTRLQSGQEKLVRKGAEIKYVPQAVIDDAVSQYTWRMRMLDRTFEKKTQLNKKEIALLMVATCLQCIRIYGVNHLTEIEKAGKGKKESFLHKKQEQLLSGLKKAENEKARAYYAPLNQIVLTYGVPYDATKYTDKSLKLFENANHRFSTLGHDPMLGLLIGTANIMTNTITVVDNATKIPKTYHVAYDSNYKNPVITNGAEFTKVVNEVIERTEKDEMPLVAALLKQLIHIATDIYTPAGIQLPGANIVLSKQNVESLTKYISMGDVVKLQVSSQIEHLIDSLIRVIHGCLLLEDRQNLEEKTHQVKSNKIVTYSKAISSGSNLIEKIITQKYNELDFNGLINLVINCFKDLDFMYEVKYEFIRNGLGEE